ncbi:HlyD family type I secretion periplasmic adaptor subunit [Sulfitobacter sp. 1A10445]|uniref:HlyD family type I secretion periplasmic adaptor subunit n=1 Tax=unclassified Sulfitobacter TaxID=196795 RepID=UPI003746E607
MKTSPRFYARLGYLVIFLIFGGLGSWAATAVIDSAVVAPGTVALEGDRKVVQHLNGGIIREIRVKEADQVKEGDVLILLESVEARSNLNLHMQRLNVARATEARLLAEQTSQENVEFPQDLLESEDPRVQKALRTQRQIFEDRRSILLSQTEILEYRLEQLNEQITGLELQKSAMERRVALRTAHLDRLKSGEQKGVIESNRLVEREDTLIETEASLGEVISEASQVRGATGEARLNLLKLVQEYRERANLELKDVQAEISELTERVLVAKDTLDRTVIRAPTSGSVQDLQATTVGSVVRPGEVLMEIVPVDENLVIDARVAPVDIDSVVPGMETEVRLSAFKTKLMPIVFGTVQSVSSDVISPKDPNDLPYYLARIHVPEANLPEGIKGNLTPGMPGDAVIVTGERTVLNYLVSPLSEAVSKSFREE